MRLLKEHSCFGGKQQFYEHASTVIGLPMRFAVYLPPQAATQAVPALMFLAGLTCTEETFVIKSGAQRWAAELGLALICPDTSPRGAGVVGETDSWDLGVGAGFYIDAKQAPWSQYYLMESYLMAELLPLVCRDLNIDARKLGIFGHSMGGHGALTLALKHPTVFQSLSAFAPICAPSQCPWGEKAFTAYLGEDQSAWAMHDASVLMAKRPNALLASEILIDQGLNDTFLSEQLDPQAFEKACAQAGQALQLRRYEGYDHGYFFIQTFIEDHLRHHARYLQP